MKLYQETIKAPVRQVTVLMSESSVIHSTDSFKWLIHSGIKQVRLSFWMGHWIIGL